jgi:uncharacterized membrane protein
MDLNFKFESETYGYDESDRKSNNVIYAITYIPILCWLPFVVDSTKGSELAKFHANQSLNLLLAGFAAGIVVAIIYVFGIIPIIGWVFGLVGRIVNLLLNLAVGGLALTGLISAAQGNVLRLPVVGDFRIIK